MRRTSLLLILALALAACTAPEQPATPPVDSTAAMVGDRPDATNPAGNPDLEVPPGWKARFDNDEEFALSSIPDSSDVYFVTMTPGWHVTTTPAGIFWHPASTAGGNFSAVTQIHLFDPGERNEGFGLFVGGTDLDGAGQSYIYFLLRRTGDFLVKRRTGEDTETLIDWTSNAAVIPFNEQTESTASNTLRVTVAGDMILFLVNEVQVASLPSAGLVTDGVVGLRINHALNVHVAEFAVVPAA